MSLPDNVKEAFNKGTTSTFARFKLGDYLAQALGNSSALVKCSKFSVGYAALNTAGDGNAALFSDQDSASIPDNAIVYKAFYDVTTTFQDSGTSSDADTSTLQIGIEDQSADLVSQVSIDNAADWDAGIHESLVPGGDNTDNIKLSAARQLAVTWSAGTNDATALVAGAMDVYVFWVQGS